ncbi:MAG: translation elongation factor Ts [Bryobacterales bacterium]|nr:translation elongation factor Ts [Bryobacterales bacterium]
MAEITAQLVKELRERTGAGMMECKKALVEASGDLAEAEVVLRKRGIAAAAKKSSRATRQGLIASYLNDDATLGVLIEVNCESDFVARTEEFQAMAANLAKQVAESGPYAEGDEGLAQLNAQPYIADPSTTVAQLISASIAKIGENQGIPRLARLAVAGTGGLGLYIHPGSQLGVLIELSAKKAETSSKEDFQELVKDLAMQVAAADPMFIRKEDVEAAVLDREKDIQRGRALAEGKPEKMVDRIVEGRMAKFYEEICLLEQPFIKENTLTVNQLVSQKAASLGDELDVVRCRPLQSGRHRRSATRAPRKSRQHGKALPWKRLFRFQQLFRLPGSRMSDGQSSPTE